MQRIDALSSACLIGKPNAIPCAPTICTGAAPFTTCLGKFLRRSIASATTARTTARATGTTTTRTRTTAAAGTFCLLTTWDRNSAKGTSRTYNKNGLGRSILPNDSKSCTWRKCSRV